jgi:hypothetical protein
VISYIEKNNKNENSEEENYSHNFDMDMIDKDDMEIMHEDNIDIYLDKENSKKDFELEN